MKSQMANKLALLLLLVAAAVSGRAQGTPPADIHPYSERVATGDAAAFGQLQAEDVAFQRTVWRMLDLEEPANAPFFFPASPVGTKKNMISILLDGVRDGSLKAYQPAELGNEFQTALQMTPAEVEAALGAIHDSIAVLDENGRRVWVARDQESSLEDIQKVLVKEMVYFDKRNAHLQWRVIGICPIRMIPKDGADGQDDMVPQQTFWVPVAPARNLLNHAYVTTGNNEARQMSMNAYLTQRRFKGLIYAISNARGNQRLADYVESGQIAAESDRLEQEIAALDAQIW